MTTQVPQSMLAADVQAYIAAQIAAATNLRTPVAFHSDDRRHG
jgi:hypothetical protein